MNIEFILQQIDLEIERLQQVRSLLSGLSASKNPTRKRTFSTEARKRIAAAQKKRWAAVKAKKGTAKG
jgi:hypothetical protein